MNEFIDENRLRQQILNNVGAWCDLHGVSGYEDDVTQKVFHEIKEYVDDISIDPLGNIIGFKKGTGKEKLLIAAHIDEIGLMVRHIDDRGFLYVEKIGGIRTQNLFARTCSIKTEKGFVDGLVNTINPGRPKAIKEIPEIREFFIDIGATSKQEAVEMGIELGNTVSLNYEFKLLGKNRIIGKALDNRLLVFILIEVMKLCKDTGIETPNIFPVFTVQEEVGCRGARTAAYTVNPDTAIALDVTVANDTPQIAKHDYISQLDHGPGIKLMDKIYNGMGMISSPKMVQKMKSIARNNNIPFQLEVFPSGTTDAAAMHLERGGIPSGGIAIPTRYVHAHEMASVDDIVHTILFLFHYIREFKGGHQWQST
ncbi:M42 family metallopeptidase [Evansella sp. AB-rgal1]|uniref:M42 family metallopeptidase n=1 Tax=Evansella sp. AB-rgal1 TaxID=3242696 RepID=UPI00359E6EDC